MTSELPKGIIKYPGKSIDTMPRILNNSDIPMSSSRIMKERLEYGESFPNLLYGDFNTSDLIIYPGDPKDFNKFVYFFLTVNNRGEITPGGRKALELIKDGNLARDKGIFIDKLFNLGKNGLIEVPIGKIKGSDFYNLHPWKLNQQYSNASRKEQIMNNTIWRILSRNPNEVSSEFAEDEKLLEEYFDFVKSITKKPENMASNIQYGSLENRNTLKTWKISKIDHFQTSDIDGKTYMDSPNGIFLCWNPWTAISLDGDVQNQQKPKILAA